MKIQLPLFFCYGLAVFNIFKHWRTQFLLTLVTKFAMTTKKSAIDVEKIGLMVKKSVAT